MKAFLIPLVLLVLGTGAGAAAGFLLTPDTPDTVLAECPEPETKAEPSVAEPNPAREYAKLNNQFVVPVVADGRVAALVVLSLNLEVTTGSRTAIFAAEPKLRDRFLQVMFDHANIGGFTGNFTEGTNMRLLRDDLLQAAQEISDSVTDVLITDIVRQDT